MNTRMQLKDAVAIVTGGGTGIGRATSLRLAQAGARAVYVNYSRSAEDAEATARELIDLGCEGIAHRCDVAVDSECRAIGADGKAYLLVKATVVYDFIVSGLPLNNFPVAQRCYA